MFLGRKTTFFLWKPRNVFGKLCGQSPKDLIMNERDPRNHEEVKEVDKRPQKETQSLPQKQTSPISPLFERLNQRAKGTKVKKRNPPWTKFSKDLSPKDASDPPSKETCKGLATQSQNTASTQLCMLKSYIYIHSYIHTSIHSYTHTHKHTHTHAHAHAHAHRTGTRTRTHTHTYTYTYKFRNKYTYTFTVIYVFTHTKRRTCQTGLKHVQIHVKWQHINIYTSTDRDR